MKRLYAHSKHAKRIRGRFLVIEPVRRSVRPTDRLPDGFERVCNHCEHATRDGVWQCCICENRRPIEGRAGKAVLAASMPQGWAAARKTARSTSESSESAKGSLTQKNGK